MFRQLLAVLTLSLSVPCAFAQIDFENVHVHFFIPTILDGTSGGAQWRTTFTITNRSSETASVLLESLNNDGSPMGLTIQNIQDTSFSIRVPAGATREYTTSAGGGLQNGWALLSSTVPIIATARVTQTQGNTVRSAAVVESNVPTVFAWADVSANTTLSLANPYSDVAVTTQVRVRNNSGENVASINLTLPPFGRVSFQLPERFTGMPGDFTGTLQVEGETADDVFVAGLLDRDAAGGIRGSRAARILSPTSHYDNLWLTYRRILSAAKRNLPDVNLEDIRFRITYNKEVNAQASDGTDIRIDMGLAELINDSPSETAFVIAHELARILQQRTRAFVFNSNPDVDADSWAVVFSLVAGYDPYGSVGGLAKLAMATGPSGLASQFEDQPAEVANRSLNERLSGVFDLLKTVCASDAAKNACSTYRSVVHPNMPDATPLSKPGVKAVTRDPKVRTERDPAAATGSVLQ